MIASLLTGLRAAFAWLGAQLVAIVSTVWTGFLGVLDVGLAWVVGALGWLIEGTVGLLFGALALVSGLFLDMPTLPEGPTFDVSSYLGLANRYLPLTEAVSMAAIWAVVYGGLFLYKGGKFLRGGG